jgi:transposase InsO family protein
MKDKRFMKYSRSLNKSPKWVWSEDQESKKWQIEFKNTNIQECLDEEGIGHELSVPYTPQQNGIVERKNRTLIEAARTMLDE